LKKIENAEETPWSQQFINACMLHPSKDDEGEISDIEGADAFMHLATIGWKLFFSLVPPPHIAGGWLCFSVALAFIGIVTAVVGEVATLFGCVLGIKPSITAITFVALGTSLPDTFASMAAARAEKFADSAVGNVTGSNSVNVFLGLGLPWVIATLWSANFTIPTDGKWNDKKDAWVARFGGDLGAVPNEGTALTSYYVPAGTLGFSVVVFIICACTCFITLIARRFMLGGELGGSSTGRLLSCLFLCCLWLVYVVMSTM
jgi:Ca2+/Na+ antiporter